MRARFALAAGGVVGMWCAAAVPTASAEGEALAGDGLKAAVTGRTIALDTPVGSLPISYRANGTMTGESWGLGKFTGTEKDKGRWWIDADRLCQRWDVWLDGETNCYALRKNGSKVHWKRQDGRTGIAMIVK